MAGKVTALGMNLLIILLILFILLNEYAIKFLSKYGCLYLQSSPALWVIEVSCSKQQLMQRLMTDQSNCEVFTHQRDISSILSEARE